MQKHYFITNHQLNSTRWQKAFAQATLLDKVSIPPRVESDSFVWIFSGVDHWDDLVSYYAQAGCKVLVLTASENLDELRMTLEAGARGYLSALANVDNLKQAAESVQQGAMWLPALLVARMVGQLNKLVQPKNDAEALLAQLTDRERDVTQAILTGATNKEIARLLNITERTVKAHLSSIFGKLGARDRMHLMMLVRGY